MYCFYYSTVIGINREIIDDANIECNGLFIIYFDVYQILVVRGITFEVDRKCEENKNSFFELAIDM